MDTNKFSKAYVAYPFTEEAMAFSDTSGLPIYDITIGITNPDKNYKISRKNLPFFTFEYVIEGKGEIVKNGVKMPVIKGDTYLLLENDSIEYHSIPSAPMRKLWINFKCDYMAKMLESYNLTTGVYKADTESLFKNLLYYSKSDKPFFEIYSAIADCIHNIVITVALSQKTSNINEAYYIKEYLLSAVYKKISLEEVSKTLNMSESNVIRVFKKSFGITPYEFLINAKIDAAKLLLSTSAMSVKEIADRIKITDEHYFSSVFYKKTGLRPTAYRKAQKVNI